MVRGKREGFSRCCRFRVALSVRLTWERGKEALNCLRQELGVEADELIPLVNGGINFSKLRCDARHVQCCKQSGKDGKNFA